MIDMEKTFQQMIDEAVERALDKYGEKIERLIQERDRLLTVSDISRLTGFSTMAVRNWINREEDPLPAFRVEKEYRVKPEVFWQWFDHYGTGRKKRTESLIEGER